jgi:chitin disaccharide deacetylase
MFRRLVGKVPTHIDSHQHVHRREPVRAVLIALARKLAGNRSPMQSS